MNTAYLNCSSGIAGDMFLAAFIDAGISLRAIERDLKQALKVPGWSLSVKRVERGHVRAPVLTVRGDRQFSSPAEMRRLVTRGRLAGGVKARSLEILDRLIEAESRVHGVSREKVHFHELNSIDTLVDVVGSCLVLERAGIGEVYSSPVNIGRPAPAALEILKKYAIPVYATDARYELTTPTGAAITSVVVSAFGPMPAMTVRRSGYGAGTAERETHPNMVQVLIGESGHAAGEYTSEKLVILSTNIDDMDPRIYPHVQEQLLAAGANDAWLTQIMMKKGRPGILLSVLCRPADEVAMEKILFRETTTLGVRREEVMRYALDRRFSGGGKIARLPGGGQRVKSEFEDAKKSAASRRIPLVRILK